MSDECPFKYKTNYCTDVQKAIYEDYYACKFMAFFGRMVKHNECIGEDKCPILNKR